MNKQFLLEVLKETIDIFTFLIKLSLFILPSLISFLLFLFGIGSLLVSSLKDDDDDEYVTPFLAYQALRMNAELGQFIPVIGIPDMYRFIMSPSATLRPIVDAAKLLKQLVVRELPYRTGELFGYELDGIEKDIYYQRKSGVHLKGDSKTAAMTEKLLPILRGIEQSQTPEEALKFFTGAPM